VSTLGGDGRVADRGACVEAQIEQIDAVFEVGDDVGAAALGEDEAIGPGFAVEGVVARAAPEHVGSVAAVEEVGILFALEFVRTRLTEEPIHARTAK
jgi:hypothetical protein